MTRLITRLLQGEDARRYSRSSVNFIYKFVVQILASAFVPATMLKELSVHHHAVWSDSRQYYPLESATACWVDLRPHTEQ